MLDLRPERYKIAASGFAQAGEARRVPAVIPWISVPNGCSGR